MGSEKSDGVKSNIRDDYIHYDPALSEHLKERLISVSNNGNQLTSADIDRWFGCGKNFAGQFISHLNRLGVIEQTGTTKEKIKIYKVRKNETNKIIGDVRRSIIPNITKRDVIHKPNGVHGALNDNMLYVLDSDSLRGVLNNNRIRDVLVVQFNPETYYIESVLKEGSCHISNEVNTTKKYPLSWDEVYHLIRLEYRSRNENSGRPGNIRTITLNHAKSRAYLITEPYSKIIC
ncbi:MAG: hypothetical protein KAT91_00780 [Candidatus Aenigmarchaeota archaeon]|nr:hypothetical protein [Candidatus Aenigmarchaeota archaeon]